MKHPIFPAAILVLFGQSMENRQLRYQNFLGEASFLIDQSPTPQEDAEVSAMALFDYGLAAQEANDDYEKRQPAIRYAQDIALKYGISHRADSERLVATLALKGYFGHFPEVTEKLLSRKPTEAEVAALIAAAGEDSNEQLEHFARQLHKEYTLWSDAKSSEGTVELINATISKYTGHQVATSMN